jgi:hypothetical protein
MKTVLAVAASLMLSCALVQGAERGFNDIVRAISDQLHTRPMHIPFFGLVNLAASVAHPAGVRHIDLAVFEGLDEEGYRDTPEKIRKAIDHGWKPFLQVRSWNHGQPETVLVYIGDEAANCRLLVVTVEQHDATVVEIKLNPEALQVWLNGDRGVNGLRPVTHTF